MSTMQIFEFYETYIFQFKKFTTNTESVSHKLRVKTKKNCKKNAKRKKKLANAKLKVTRQRCYREIISKFHRFASPKSFFIQPMAVGPPINYSSVALLKGFSDFLFCLAFEEFMSRPVLLSSGQPTCLRRFEMFSCLDFVLIYVS